MLILKGRWAWGEAGLYLSHQHPHGPELKGVSALSLVCASRALLDTVVSGAGAFGPLSSARADDGDLGA